MIKNARNKVIHFLYKKALKPILFQFEPELMHKTFVKIGAVLGSNPVTREITSALFSSPESKMLEQNILGIKFKNPIGLSAGFDKNAELTEIMPEVGFGYMEVGSITAKYCSGNSGIRLKRLPERKSLWVHLGLNNNGVDEISNRLKKRKFEIPIGVSIAKTNCRETANSNIAVDDYVYSLKKMNEKNIGDFFVINISCPNAYGGQPFSNPKLFEKLIKKVSGLRIKKPIFVKMSPDMSKKDVDKVISISEKYKVSGFICTNLTKKHEMNKGGLSGKVVEKMANKMIKYIYNKTDGKLVIIGVGGVFSAKDAYEKIKCGASLVSLITGMIYEGPNLISDINLGLIELLKMDGYRNIGDAVGKDVK